MERKPTWGTCAGLILLAEAANRTKKGGQDLIGGIDVRVNRNHFGRQVESFQTPLALPFLDDMRKLDVDIGAGPFNAVFIRAPIVEKVLPRREGAQEDEEHKPDTIVAPTRAAKEGVREEDRTAEVEVLATLDRRATRNAGPGGGAEGEEGDIVAVRQGNVFGTSFHPELTDDARIHVWWLSQVLASVQGS